MRIKPFIGSLLLSLSIGVSGCVGHIPIVGLDKDGKVIETMVKKRSFVKRLSESTRDMQDSMIPALDSDEARKMSTLREATLGLHLKGEAGIGDYFKLGGQIGFRFLFANQ